MEKLLSIDETADTLALKRATLYKYIHLRKIPFIKLGARVAFRPSDLEAWVSERSFTPPALVTTKVPAAGR